jgi:gliding-associated putative ABC transporter substrate-binding component GldG
MPATDSTINKRKAAPGKKLIAVIAILIAANITAWFFYGQIDLTKDKRYTITDATQHMLKHLDRKMEVTVFLDGDGLPAAFQSLANSTEAMLRHFRDISGNKVTYHFTDPLGSDTTALQVLKQYRMSGLPVTVNEGKKGTSQKMIFPWALISTVDDKGNAIDYPVFLQETNTLVFNRQTLLKSEILLEYNLANGIHHLSQKERTSVAYVLGNGEQFVEHVAGMIMNLAQTYVFDTFNIDGVNSIPSKIKTIIIQNPTVPFNDTQKFKLDQYVMNGGHIIWSLNTVTGNIDSMNAGHFSAMPIDLNLNNLLFNYGVRVNTNMVEDATECIFIPLQAKKEDAEATTFPWIYFPILKAGSDHPIVKNLSSGVLARFVSSIDLVGEGSAVEKTVLLSSGRYSKSEPTPMPVILESAIVPPNPAEYMQHNLIAAVLLEGNFSSAYSANRPVALANWIAASGAAIKDQSGNKGKMIVLSDGDIFTNDFSPQAGPLEMGVFKWDRPPYKFDNQAFLLNCMEYLNDDENLLEARNKNFDNRILDPKVVNDERTKWQFINIGLPVVAVLIFGAVFFYVRKRKYA